MAVELARMNDAIIYEAPPWSRKPYKLKARSFPRGKVPEHLAKYLFTKGGVPTQCANETKGLKGKERVLAMNSCVSSKLKKVL